MCVCSVDAARCHGNQAAHFPEEFVSMRHHSTPPCSPMYASLSMDLIEKGVRARIEEGVNVDVAANKGMSN